MNFKHGDRVKCTIKGVDIKDARISIDKDGTPFICQNKKAGWIADDMLGYKYSWILSEESEDRNVTNLRPVKKSFDYPEIGDEYVFEGRNSRFVLGVAGRVIFLSSFLDKDSFAYGTTKERLIEEGCTIVQDEHKKEEPEEPTEMTLEEIEKLVVKKVKIVEKK